jgi:hypothetical protein
VANAVEAFRQDVEQEPADERARIERHGAIALAPVATVVLDPEGDAALVERDQSVVRDRDPVGVAAEIGEHGLGSRERRLGVDEPVLAPEWCEVGDKSGFIAQEGQLAEESQLAGGVCSTQPREHQAAEQA